MKKLLFSFALLSLATSCTKDSESLTPIPKFTVTIVAGEGGSVSSLGGEYEQGKKINVTASPNDEYIFSDWSDGVTDNPRELLVSSNLILTANFIKRKYNLNISINGSGSVSEEVIVTGKTSEYNSGTQLKLTANPTDGWSFMKWSNDIESFDNPLVIDINRPINITANFGVYVNYKGLFSGINVLTSHYQPYNTPFVDLADILDVALVKYGGYTLIGSNGDFNGNDIPDLVILESDSLSEEPGVIHIIVDNEKKHTIQSPQAFTRKIAIADLDNNGFEDIVLFGHGIDKDPYTGDATAVLFNFLNSYKIDELSPEKGFFHTGTIGDLNNDGHLDILPFNNQATRLSNRPEFTPVYWGSGDGKFQMGYTNIPYLSILNMYHAELFDINGDGKLDLISGGHEWVPSWYDGSFSVFWDTAIYMGVGNGEFEINNPLVIPPISGWGIITDFDFYDLDGDGEEEIIVTRTSGSSDENIVTDNQSYDGLKIQILKYSGAAVYEHMVLNQPADWFSDPNMHIEWPMKTTIFDVNYDGLLDIVPESDKLNSKSYTPNLKFKGIYYRQLQDGSFEIDYQS